MDTTRPQAGSGTVETAEAEARDVGQTAAQAGSQVVGTATEQGRQVAQEAGRQARDLYGQARGELRKQAGAQQRRAAGGLRAVGEEIRTMAHQGGGSGPATDVAHRASDKIGQVADWLENREPGQVLDEVKGFARRHPGTFLAGAALLGVLAGRLTRNVAAEAGVGPGSDNGFDDGSGNGSANGARSSAGDALAAGYAAPPPSPYVEQPLDSAPGYREPAGSGSGYADPAYPDPAGAGDRSTDILAADEDEYAGTVYTTGAAADVPPAGGTTAPLVDPVPVRAVPPQTPPADGVPR